MSHFFAKTVSPRPSPDDENELRRSSEQKDIVVIDEQSLSRDCISFVLKIAYSRRVLGSFASLEALLAAPAEAFEKAVILYCVHHRRISDPAIRTHVPLLARAFPKSPIILLSDWEVIDEVGAALEQGVQGFIPTSMPFDVAIRAIDLVCAGGIFVPSNSLASAPETRPDWAKPATPAARLTERQQAVLRLLQRGQTNRIIARELGLSEGTVKAHVRNIMQKLKAANRTQVLFLTQKLDDENTDVDCNGGNGENAASDPDLRDV